MVSDGRVTATSRCRASTDEISCPDCPAEHPGRAATAGNRHPRWEISDRVLWLEDGQFRSLSQMVTGPVCGMAVEREGTPHYWHDGQTYYFCSPGCREEFAASPNRFLQLTS